jgi:hypothetical protein
MARQNGLTPQPNTADPSGFIADALSSPLPWYKRLFCREDVRLEISLVRDIHPYFRFREKGNIHAAYIRIRNLSSETDADDVEVKAVAQDVIKDATLPFLKTEDRSEMGVQLPFDDGQFVKTIRPDNYEYVKVASLNRARRDPYIQLGEYGEDLFDDHGRVFQMSDPHRVELVIKSTSAREKRVSVWLRCQNDMLEMRIIK